jgi:hypothetical protein
MTGYLAHGNRRSRGESMDPEAHWQHVWKTRAFDEVGWFEADPTT